MNIADLEKMVKDAEKQLAAKEAKERPKPPPKEEPTAVAVDIFTLGPVFDYLDHLKKEPREILEARFIKEVGELAFRKEARHEWLVHNLAYNFQLRYYQAHERKVPDYMVQRICDVARSSWHPRVGQQYNTDDPATDSLEIWEDTYVAAAQPNPFSKGDARTAFFCVEIAGPNGVGFTPLCKTLEEMLECAVPRAQDLALEMFTKKVREGLTKIVIRPPAE